MKPADLLAKYRQSINPPYRPKDFLTIGATLFILLAVPLTVILANQARELRSQAVGQPTQVSGGTAQSVPDEILLKFKPGATEKAKSAVHKMYGLSMVETIPQIGVEKVKVPPKARDKVIAALSHNPAIEFAEVNGIAKTQDTIPNDPSFGYQWEVKKVQGPAAWDITTGSPSVVIAVVDGGAWGGHPDLSGKVLTGYNTFTGTSDASDDNGHGTWVTGVAAAATNNGVGMAGMSWLSPVIPVKVCDSTGSCPYSNVAKGMTWAADHGANVINMSLGGAGSCPSSLQSAVDYAWNKGLVIVAAAGNEGAPVDTPANCNHTIAVGATDSTDSRTTWSNYGSTLDLVAPGTSLCPSLSGGYAWGSGTSFSAPFVSGAAALLMAKGASNTAAVLALTAGADDLGNPGWDQYYGYGRLNAYKALLALGGVTPPPDTVAPTVSISSPTAGSTVSGQITVSGSASDNVGVTKVELYLDGSIYATAAVTPYSFYWDTTTATNGSHTLSAKAYDAANNIGTSATITVTVNNPASDTTPPTTSITSPVNGATVSGTATITASAIDNVSVSSVSFFVDGAFIGEDTTSPYLITWDTTTYTNASHTIQSTAVDTSNNVGQSAIITVTVNNTAADTTPPTVSIISPAAGSTLTRNTNITITASASDNVGVNKVEFYVSGSLKCTDTTSPYSCTWKIPGAKGKTYQLQAKAYDAAGNIGVSPIISVSSR
jgi:subtilisin family serine protease